MANANPLDVVWILLCTGLVVVMQPGFTLLETGLVRAKNSVSVAVKNLADFCIAGALYGLLGFGLMYGDSIGGAVGSSRFFFDADDSPWHQAFLLFHLSFCATAVTIIAGAVAERMRFVGYLIVAALTAVFVYPVVGHWVWAGKLSGVATGWLEKLGFIDFAGATVVHGVGGSAALAAVLIIGPRLGRFDRAGSAAFGGHNLTLAAAGTFLLIIGWLGFNGGSALAVSDRLPLIFLNTIIAGSYGGVVATVISWANLRVFNATYMMTGVLAGFVGITAACNTADPLGAAVIGAVSGGLCVAGTRLLEKLKIDDAVGAVPVHLLPGIWGALAVALIADPVSFPTGQGRAEQLSIQFVGVVSVIGYSFSVIYASLWLCTCTFALRTSPDVEREGLSVSEHGARSEIHDLAVQMNERSRSRNFTHGVEVNPYSDLGKVEVEYNRVVAAVRSEMDERHAVEEQLRERARTDVVTGLANRRHFDESLALEWDRALRERTDISLIFLDVDHFKRFNDTYGHQAGDLSLARVADAMASMARRPSDLAARFGGEEFVMLLPNTNVEGAAALAEQIRLAVLSLDLAVPTSMEAPRVSASIGVASMRARKDQTCDLLVKAADAALYRAKRGGRNQVTLADMDLDAAVLGD